jgi:hypothetical protein
MTKYMCKRGKDLESYTLHTHRRTIEVQDTVTSRAKFHKITANTTKKKTKAKKRSRKEGSSWSTPQRLTPERNKTAEHRSHCPTTTKLRVQRGRRRIT